MELVWYFAYGANMATDVLLRRRGLQVVESRVGHARGHRVGFVERGFPLVEPAFAGLVPAGELDAHTTDAWGVLHRLPSSDLRRLDRFEGPGYVRRRVVVHDGDGEPHEADAYLSPRPVPGRRPSRRYRDLLLCGARQHGLPSPHLAWLRAHPTVYVPLLSESVVVLASLAESIARTRR